MRFASPQGAREKSLVNMMRTLSGQVVAVVGANGGLGSVLTQALRNKGATVFTTARDAGRLADASLYGDVTHTGFAEQVVQEAVASHGKIDGIINATGCVAFGPLKDLADSTVEQLWQVNLFAPLRMMRAFANSGTKGGFFVNISGVVAETPFPGLAAYGAMKAALSSATRVFAMESRRDGTLVVDARPPHTETGLALRPIAGTAPRMPTGLTPEAVANRIILAIENEEAQVPAAAFR